MSPRPVISVIVPTLDEEARLPASLAGVVGRPEVEVVVVDGGSRDDTVTVAGALGARVVRARRGRARQMNAGAAVARGDILLFLHADTRLPTTFVEDVRRTLAHPGTVAGAFRFALDARGATLRLIEYAVDLRCRLFQLPYGDQALFLGAVLFERLGGFPDVPVMEDFELVRRLRRQGRIELTRGAAVTSARGWARWGVVRFTAVNQLTLLAWKLGLRPEHVARARSRLLRV